MLLIVSIRGENVLFLINQFDNNILRFIENNMHSYIMDKTMIFFTELGNMGIIWIVISILLMLNKKYRIIGIATLAAVALGALLGEGIIKHIIERPRPFVKSSYINLLISKPMSSSFPSGHTTAAFSASGILSSYFRKYSIEIFLLAFVIAFSRLYLYVHYPTDVLAGIILGIISSRIILYLFNKIGYF